MDDREPTARDLTQMVREVDADAAITDDRIDSLDWRLARVERRLLEMEQAIRGIHNLLH